MAAAAAVPSVTCPIEQLNQELLEAYIRTIEYLERRGEATTEQLSKRADYRAELKQASCRSGRHAGKRSQ